MVVRSNMLELKNKLEIKERRRYTAKEIAEATGLSRHTINGLLMGDSKAIYFDTIGKLIQFFQERGMIVAVQDLIVVERSSEVGTTVAE